MKSLTLVKPSPCIQLGHMYEHIYCHVVAQSLYDAGLFDFVDYDLIGNTYYGGVIVIEYLACTPEAAQQIIKLPHLEAEISEDTMYDRWNEIESEKQEILSYDSVENVLSGLRELQAQPWQNIDDIEAIDTRNIRKYTKPLYVAEGKYPRNKKLLIKFELDEALAKNQRHLLPLYDRLIKTLGNNIQHLITRNFGLYYKGDSFQAPSRNRLIYSLEFNTYPEFNFDDQEISQHIHDCHQQLKHRGGYERLLRLLQQINSTDDYTQAPNIEYLYGSTSQIVGAKGWRKIATDENCKLILSGVTIQVKFGHRSFSVSL